MNFEILLTTADLTAPAIPSENLLTKLPVGM